MSSPLVSAGLRGCVERILSGDVRAQDLHSVFFGLRQESGGKGIVREVAHFVAHPEPRTQGLSHAELRDAFTAFRFRMQLETSKVITSDIPGSLPDR